MAAPDIQRILCPVDFSLGSEAALRLALFFGRAYGAEVSLLHVDPHPAIELPGGSGPEEERRRALTERIEALAEEHRAEGVSLRADVVQGPPYEAIVVYARAAQVDLVVIGTHGRTGVKRLLMGSVAERVVRHSPVPVATVRRGEHDTPPSSGLFME